MAKRKRGRDISGLIILDKPAGESSNQSLQKVKRLLGAAKAGHTGSLDPLATGVLPLCFGESTKISQFLLDSDKGYRARFRFGERTDTGDSEGEITERRPVDGIDAARIEQAMAAFNGEIDQIPSMYSALKHQGVPLYKLAREGKTIERKARRVTIYRFDLLAVDEPEGALEAEVDIQCSKGTYVRTLADDLGEALGCGAHVTALRRTRAGPFAEEQCVTFETLEQALRQGGPGAADHYLLPSDQAVEDLPPVVLPPATAAFVKQGQPVIARHLPTEGLVRIYEDEHFIGIGAILDDGRVAPRRLMKN